MQKGERSKVDKELEKYIENIQAGKREREGGRERDGQKERKKLQGPAGEKKKERKFKREKEK